MIFNENFVELYAIVWLFRTIDIIAGCTSSRTCKQNRAANKLHNAVFALSSGRSCILCVFLRFAKRKNEKYFGSFYGFTQVSHDWVNKWRRKTFIGCKQIGIFDIFSLTFVLFLFCMYIRKYTVILISKCDHIFA